MVPSAATDVGAADGGKPENRAARNKASSLWTKETHTQNRFTKGVKKKPTLTLQNEMQEWIENSVKIFDLN